MQTIHLDPAMVPPAMRGNYSGKQFKAIVSETVTIPADAGLWSGGSRETYRVIHLETGHDAPAADHNASPWDNRRDNTITLQPGFAVVCHSLFCGKDMGLTFYVHPQNAAKLLPAPVELSELDKVILAYTRARKSSYAGKDRYAQAADDWQWKARGKTNKLFYTRDQWEAGKADLATRGLLNKAGALTTAGKNAASNLRDGF